MIESLGHMPEEDESFVYEGITFEASKVDDDGKVIRVTVSINDDEDEADETTEAEKEENK